MPENQPINTYSDIHDNIQDSGEFSGLSLIFFLDSLASLPFSLFKSNNHLVDESKGLPFNYVDQIQSSNPLFPPIFSFVESFQIFQSTVNILIIGPQSLRRIFPRTILNITFVSIIDYHPTTFRWQAQLWKHFLILGQRSPLRLTYAHSWINPPSDSKHTRIPSTDNEKNTNTQVKKPN